MMQRPRATQACTHCRARKVRCDATRTGIPCSNCVFDSKPCYVRRRKQRGEPYHQTEEQRINRRSSMTPQIIRSIENDHELSKHHSETGMKPCLSKNVHDHHAGATSTLRAFIPWSHYDFLSLDTCSRLPQHDMESLNREDCLLIPRRPLLDELIQEYFLHVHPNLPVMDESEFWAIYHGTSNKSMALMCLQAMIFAGSSFVSQRCIQELGFSSVPMARSSFYERAKTLYDLNSDQDQLQSAQCALIFTYYVSARCASINSYWLTVAIHHAREIQADRYYQICHPKANFLKRIWWACICRDRLLALGLRRPLQIGPGDFDLTQPVPDTTDFENEIFGSRVYRVSSKRQIVQLFRAQCELAIALTNCLSTLFPRCPTISSHSYDLSTLVDQLEKWFEDSYTKLFSYQQEGIQDESVVLYTNLLQAYYHSAQIALLNHAISLSVTHDIYGNGRHNVISSTGRVKHRLADLVKGMDRTLQVIDQLGLIRFLPITMVAYFTFPLVWYLIGDRISPMPESETKRYLKLYIDAMNCLQTQYEGAEKVLGHIKVIVGQLHFQFSGQRNIIDDLNATSTSRSEFKYNNNLATKREESIDLSDIAVFQPKKYLLITYSIDSCLSRGSLPDISALQPAKTIVYLPNPSIEYSSSRRLQDCWGESVLPDDFALYDLALHLGLTGASLDYDLDDAADRDLNDAHMTYVDEMMLNNTQSATSTSPNQ